MKLLPGFCLCLLLSVPALAQDAREGTVRFKKEDRNGVMADYNIPQGQTEDALTERLKAANLGKKHKESGFWKYKGVNWPEIAPTTIDVYFDVERENGHSVVSMLVSPGNGNFVTSATDPQIILNMKAFLTKFGPEVVAYQEKIALADQQRVADEAARDLARANRETDRANSRQKKADREKGKMQEAADAERRKLEELQKTSQPKSN